jgi:hypothetical protein
MLHKHCGKFIEAEAPGLESQASEDLRLPPPAPISDKKQKGTIKENQSFVPMASQNKNISEKTLEINILNGGERGIQTRRSDFVKYTCTHPQYINQ